MTDEKRGAVTVIAEAGVSHNGRLDLALAPVEAAAGAGADVLAASNAHIYASLNAIGGG